MSCRRLGRRALVFAAHRIGEGDGTQQAEHNDGPDPATRLFRIELRDHTHSPLHRGCGFKDANNGEMLWCKVERPNPRREDLDEFYERLAVRVRIAGRMRED